MQLKKTPGLKPLFVLLVAAIGLSACFNRHGATLGGIDDVGLAVLRYYKDHAVEKRGRCLAPSISTISHSALVEKNGDEAVLKVRYFYEDTRFGDPGNNISATRLANRCKGHGERNFTIDLTHSPPKVTAMTGLVKGRWREQLNS